MILRTPVWFLLVLSGILSGCVKRVHAPAAAAPAMKWPARSPDFIDLVPGSVREVTPIFASGGFVAKGLEQQSGNVITLTGTDFEGYETAIYTLKAREGGGVEVGLTSVETTKGSQTTAEIKPRVPLFQFPRRVRYIRMLYLIRVSGADHNMAVLGSDEVDRLNMLTTQVQDDPVGGCRNVRRAYCSWIPQGIAVNSTSGP
jgi:hypothetical protein